MNSFFYRYIGGTHFTEHTGIIKLKTSNKLKAAEELRKKLKGQPFIIKKVRLATDKEMSENL